MHFCSGPETKETDKAENEFLCCKTDNNYNVDNMMMTMIKMIMMTMIVVMMVTIIVSLMVMVMIMIMIMMVKMSTLKTDKQHCDQRLTT